MIRKIIFKILCENCQQREGVCLISFDRMKELGFRDIRETHSIVHCCKAVKDCEGKGHDDAQVIAENLNNVKVSVKSGFIDFIKGGPMKS